MSDRTTINVDKDSHEKAGDVKDQHGETWPEVLQWYAEHRGQNGDTDSDTKPMRVVPIEEVAGREVPRDQLNSDVMEQLDRNYEAIKEATQAAQSAKKTVEDLSGARQ